MFFLTFSQGKYWREPGPNSEILDDPEFNGFCKPELFSRRLWERHDLLSWSSAKELLPLSSFKGISKYHFEKTDISGIDSLKIWKNLGFKQDLSNKGNVPG